jgi:hypothetical protein
MFALLLSITAVAVTITLSLIVLYSYWADVKKERNAKRKLHRLDFSAR